MFYLEAGNDFKCPYCELGLSIESWNTEYGDPVPGTHYTKCPRCNMKFSLDIWVQASYKSNKMQQ